MEAGFSTRSVRQLRDATIEALFGDIFSVQSVPRCYMRDRSRILLVVRQSPAIKDVNTEVEGSAALEVVIRQRLVKTQQSEKT
jgi:hypothetical protein